MSAENVITGIFVDFAEISRLVQNPDFFYPSPVLKAELQTGAVSVADLTEAIRESQGFDGAPRNEYGSFDVRGSTYYWKVWAKKPEKGVLTSFFLGNANSKLMYLDQVPNDEKYDKIIVVQRSDEKRLLFK